MEEIHWKRDADAALEEAKRAGRMVLLDFSAAPMCSGCARLDAEVYPDGRVARLIEDNFVPVRVHVREQAEDFQRLGDRFNAHWTPTVLFLEPDGTERHRIEGFLPTEDFLAQLTLGVGRAAFARQEWDKAERFFREVLDRYPQATAAPEALYWSGVARYKRTNDPSALRETANSFATRYEDTEWAKRASIWLPQPAATM